MNNKGDKTDRKNDEFPDGLELFDNLFLKELNKEKPPAMRGIDHRKKRSQAVEVGKGINGLSARATKEGEVLSENLLDREKKILKVFRRWFNGVYQEENGIPVGRKHILSKLRSAVGPNIIKVPLACLAFAILIVLGYSSGILVSADSEGSAEQGKKQIITNSPGQKRPNKISKVRTNVATQPQEKLPEASYPRKRKIQIKRARPTTQRQPEETIKKVTPKPYPQPQSLDISRKAPVYPTFRA
ncbi:hypothetical protein N9174_00915 [bacterium]|nr:hypothetical protein [bacterium]